MKTFRHSFAQGDILVRRIKTLPPLLHLTRTEPINDTYIIAHSETGHHHVLEALPGVEHYTITPDQPNSPQNSHKAAMDLLRSFLVIPKHSSKQNHVLTHLRDTHTHEPVEFSPGVYEIIRQREFDLTKGWRLAAD